MRFVFGCPRPWCLVGDAVKIRSLCLGRTPDCCVHTCKFPAPIGAVPSRRLRPLEGHAVATMMPLRKSPQGPTMSSFLASHAACVDLPTRCVDVSEMCIKNETLIRCCCGWAGNNTQEEFVALYGNTRAHVLSPIKQVAILVAVVVCMRILRSGVHA